MSDFLNKCCAMWESFWFTVGKWAGFACCLFVFLFGATIFGISWAHQDYCFVHNEEYFIMEFPRNVQVAIGCPHYVPPEEPEEPLPEKQSHRLYNPDEWEISVFNESPIIM